ncbi:MAG: hypothetical protein LBO62_07615 [Endomicrobium sp.]|jgi:hypothetical protein|nr:hypothetical protein [Endomicrobium sp.]
MGKPETIDELNKLIEDIEELKKMNGAKSDDFVKWVRDVKQYLERVFGQDSNYLREFKKINYYPTRIILFGGEAMLKEAYSAGLAAAEDLLLSVKKDLEKPPEPVAPLSLPEEEDVSAPPILEPQKQPDIKQPEKQEEKKYDDSDEYPEFNGDSFKQQEEKIAVKKYPQESADVKIIAAKREEEIIIPDKSEPKEDVSLIKRAVKQTFAPEIKKINKKEEVQMAEPVKKVSSVPKKVLLLCRSEEPLTESIAGFISSMGYDIAMFYVDQEESLFNSNALKEAVADNAVYSIVFWKAESQYEGKNIPSMQILLATAYLTAKLPQRRVLVLYESDIDAEDAMFSGFNFLTVDSIPELMDLKIAREMDAAGLNIDFNVFKKI